MDHRHIPSSTWNLPCYKSPTPVGTTRTTSSANETHYLFSRIKSSLTIMMYRQLSYRKAAKPKVLLLLTGTGTFLYWSNMPTIRLLLQVSWPSYHQLNHTTTTMMKFLDINLFSFFSIKMVAGDKHNYCTSTQVTTRSALVNTSKILLIVYNKTAEGKQLTRGWPYLAAEKGHNKSWHFWILSIYLVKK